MKPKRVLLLCILVLCSLSLTTVSGQDQEIPEKQKLVKICMDPNHDGGGVIVTVPPQAAGNIKASGAGCDVLKEEIPEGQEGDSCGCPEKELPK